MCLRSSSARGCSMPTPNSLFQTAPVMTAGPWPDPSLSLWALTPNRVKFRGIKGFGPGKVSMGRQAGQDSKGLPPAMGQDEIAEHWREAGRPAEAGLAFREGATRQGYGEMETCMDHAQTSKARPTPARKQHT